MLETYGIAFNQDLYNEFHFQTNDKNFDKKKT